jgi:hypothetical protein
METIREIETREEMYLEIPKGGIGAEIGACKGMNSIPLFAIAKPEQLFLVDIWTDFDPNEEEWARDIDPKIWYGDNEDLVYRIFEQEIKESRIILERQLGGDFLYSLEDNSLDWIYLDSNHEYEAIFIELELSLQKVKKGGYIMGHDYVTIPQSWGSSVIRAVNERIQNGDIKMEAMTLEKWPSYLTKVMK